ncbi:MAG: hypothetical protein K5768_02805 [Firmicutes bacterium]|nr:hypothetical protein [Bacillota bacterium]
MISCTEFIPLYSEFFKFLEKKGGHDAVMEYWIYLSDRNIGDKTNPNSLASFCERLGGFEGARAYWNHTLSEEACDLYRIYDKKHRYIYDHIRHCPSRGMLNSLKHIEPYYDYCEHCNVIYQRVLKNYGIVYERDDSKKENAECCSLLYEAGNKPDFDYTKPSEFAEITDMKSEDNKYLHRDFHLLGDLALTYCGEKFGDKGVKEFLTDYTKTYYKPVIENIRINGLIAIKKWLESIYEIEEASELLHTDLKENMLTVTIDKSPVIDYMYSLGQKPSKYYIEETKTLYSAIADECNLCFNLDNYEDNGAAKFHFSVRGK